VSVARVSDTGKTLIDAGGSSFNLNALPTPAAGNSVTVAIATTATSITGVADNQGVGNTYTQVVTDFEAVGNQSVFVFKCLSIGTPSGTFTITVTLASGNYSLASAIQTSNLSAVDQTGSHKQTSGTTLAAATSSADTNADDLSLAVMTVNGTTAAQGISTPSGYNSLALENDDTLHIAGSIDYKILSATGTETVTWGISAGYSATVGALATFKGAGAAASRVVKMAGEWLGYAGIGGGFVG
jgi:hypothetical protein